MDILEIADMLLCSGSGLGGSSGSLWHSLSASKSIRSDEAMTPDPKPEAQGPIPTLATDTGDQRQPYRKTEAGQRDPKP